MALTYVRTTVELRKGLLGRVRPGQRQWSIPSERMKMRRPIWFPLSRRAVAALKGTTCSNWRRQSIVPELRKPGQVMSATTLNQALKRMGYGGRFSSHGPRNRSTATTILGLLGYRRSGSIFNSLIPNPGLIARAYDHTKFVESIR